jgi:hypothetical protein
MMMCSLNACYQYIMMMSSKHLIILVDLQAGIIILIFSFDYTYYE